MILTVCTDITVQRALVMVVRCRETAYASHSKDILSRNCISHRRPVDDHHLQIYYLRAMNGMIGVGCFVVVCQCDVSSVLI